jgi:dihydrofolate synthase/folylpolyglutamate synthase
MERWGYDEAVGYLNSLTDYETAPERPRDPANFDLRRMMELLDRLGNPHLAVPVVHIAGTKGKGSTAAMVVAVLEAAGYRTGLYTSPHLLDLRERIQVNGRMIPPAELAALVAAIKPEVAAVNERAAYGQLTTFEVLTALGFVYFRHKGVAASVLEVGLGGRLDATNVVRPEVSVITAISRDHTEVLGDTIAAIAREKAGIIKSGGRVVSGPQSPEAARVIRAVAREQAASLVEVGRAVTWTAGLAGPEGQNLRIMGQGGVYEVVLPLLGSFQQENAATAVAALEVLRERGFRIPPESIRRGLGRVSWPGRFQIISRSPRILVDGAHNAASAERLREALEQYFGKVPGAGILPVEHRALILGTSIDKDIDGIAGALCAYFDSVTVTQTRHARAMPLDKVAAAVSRAGVKPQSAENLEGALSGALTGAGHRDLVCITGSLFLVAEALAAVSRLPLSAD